MMSRAMASVRDAPCVRGTARRTGGGVRRWMRLAPLVLAVLWAVGAVLASSGHVSAQDSVQDNVLDYVESQFGGYGLRQASAAAVSPDDQFLYVTSEQDDAVVLFSRNTTTGDLTYIATYVDGENNVTGLNEPVALAISPDGKNLYVAGKEDDAIVVFSRDATTGKLAHVETEVNDAGGVEQMVDPDAVSVTPDGLNVYVAGDTALTVFRRQPNNDGKLKFVESEQGEGGGTDTSFQLRDVVVSPDNKTVYVTSHLENAVAVLDRDAGDQGKVTVAQVLQDGAGGVTGLYRAEKLSISPDGSNVYATGALSPTGTVSGTLVVFSRGGDGKLAFSETMVNGESGVDGIAGARSVETSADGKNVYVAGSTGDSLAVFARDGAGALSFVECFTANSSSATCATDVMGLAGPSGIAISIDGAYLYPTAKESDSVSIFSRNSGTGQLTFEDVLYNSDGGVPGLGGADDAAVSPDGKHVYVTGARDDSVVVFERDSQAMGELAYAGKASEGIDGVTGLVEPSSVTVSPDGKNVYATGIASGTVVVFSRDVVTGVLSYVETQFNAKDGVAGLAGAWDSVISPDGKNLYATGITSGTVAVFSRAADTGKLSFIQLQIDGASGVTGLLGASGIAASPDDKNVYVTGSGADSVVVFRRNANTGKLTFVEEKSGAPGLNGAISVDVSADGKNVYVASVVDGTVAIFQRDAASGKLSYAGSVLNAASPAEPEEIIPVLYWSVAASLDSKYVYAARWEAPGSNNDPTGNIVVFARQPESGLLSAAQVLRNDEGDIRGLRSPTSVAVSPDNANVYTTSVRDSATLVFEVVGSAPFKDVNYLPYVTSD